MVDDPGSNPGLDKILLIIVIIVNLSEFVLHIEQNLTHLMAKHQWLNG